MTKAASFTLGIIFLLAPLDRLPAQTSAADMAVNRAVINQANTIVLHQKLEDAKGAVARGDLVDAARLYQEAYDLTLQIGSGIDAETAQTIAGLAATRLELARRAQSQGDLREANTQVMQVLNADPKNAAALAFKRQNDQMTIALRGKMPDDVTLQRVPYILNDQTNASILVQDGKLLYEMGKLEEAEAKLQQALKLDPDNEGAIYYLNLAKQARYDREGHQHTIDNQDRMVQVEDAFVRPNNTLLLPIPNPYAATNLIFTGPGRQVIVSKLDRIHIDSISWPDGLPLSEVLRNLAQQSKLRDPDKKGINFMWDGNETASEGGAAPAAAGAVDPATGLPMAAPGGGESAAMDASSINVKLSLDDVRLVDVLDAIVLVADHPVKYSIEDYAVVFSSKGPDSPPLYTRQFRVDPNTFYQGMQSVGAFSFGAANLNNNGSGGSGGSSGNSGGNSGGSSGNNGSSSSGAVVPVVNIAPGSGGLRNSNNGGGGGGGGGGEGGGGGGEGVNYLTKVGPMSDVSVAAQTFFKTLGVDLTTPGKSIFFNDRLGLLFVRASEQDLDTIDSAIQTLNQVPPMVHIKARFIEVEQDDSTALGFDWYLGQFGNTVTVSGGSEASQNVPTSAANPLGIFPGNTTASEIAGSAGDQLITGGLQNSGPALATITGIMTDPNFRVVLHALEQRSGFENLAEPEVTTISGRQTQMRATEIQTIITSFGFTAGNVGTTTGGAVP